MKQFYLIIFALLTLSLNAQQQIGQNINGELAGDQSGISVSVSADGNIVAIGSPFNDDNGNNSGHIRVFENQNSNWIQLSNTIIGETEGDQSGVSVSLSDNGNILAIGARNNDGNGIISGHVRIYQNQNDIWTQIGQDIDGEASGDQSGSSVSLSSNGSVVAISAIFNNENGMTSGHVRIFENQNNIWTQIGNDINGDIAGSRLGRSVSLSSDGNIVAINFRGIDEFGFDSVRVFENENDIWTQIGDDINGESIGAGDNGSVSLSSDGSRVAFLALGVTDTFEPSGVAMVYENQNGTWTQLGDTIFTEEPNDVSGTRSLSLSGDGNVLAIGANANDGNGTNSGHVRVYENQNGDWNQLGEDIDGEVAGDLSGASVSLSANGNILAIGAYGNSDNGDFSGHTRVFDLFDLLSINEQLNLDFKLYPNPTKEQFTIQLENLSELQNITIYNNLGQLVLSSRETIINTSKLASGLYIVELESNKGKRSKKLIIE